MIKKFAILSIDESRAAKKRKLRRHLNMLEEVHIKCVDGRDPKKLKQAQQEWRIKQQVRMQAGQLGVIYSVLNALLWVEENQEPLIYFEDDAVVVADNFWYRMNEYVLDDYPEDFDFINIGLPNEERTNYNPEEHDVGFRHLAKTYNSYNNVCMIWSPKGATKALNLIGEKYGIFDQIDHMIYRTEFSGELKGYCLKPDLDIVSIVAGDPTLVHDTEWIEV